MTHAFRDRMRGLLRWTVAGLFLAVVPPTARAASDIAGCRPVAGFSFAKSARDGVVTVADRQALTRALADAKGGEVILLGPGDYGVLALRSKFRAPVILRSASSDAPACFSGLRLDTAANVTFDGLVFSYRFAGEPNGHRPFLVMASKSITFENSLFSGDVARGVSRAADGFATAKGLAIRDSQGITVTGNEFATWWKGLLISDSTDILVAGNDVHSMRSDGMNFVDVHSVVIEGNYLHDFRRSFASGDHGDMIQFWKSARLPASSDVVIRGNTIDVGTGDFAQNIFMGNGKDKTQDPKWHYRNILIENNAIIGNHSHGITVNASNGLTIRNNSLAYKFAGNSGRVGYPRIRVTPSSRNVVITGNSAYGYVGYKGQADWRMTDNSVRK